MKEEGGEVDDGGRVIPTFQQYVGPDEYTYLEPRGGLTLRDYFAAAALTGILSGRLHKDAIDFYLPKSDDNPIAGSGKRDMSGDEIAEWSKFLADAVLKARSPHGAGSEGEK